MPEVELLKVTRCHDKWNTSNQLKQPNFQISCFSQHTGSMVVIQTNLILNVNLEALLCVYITIDGIQHLSKYLSGLFLNSRETVMMSSLHVVEQIQFHDLSNHVFLTFKGVMLISHGYSLSRQTVVREDVFR